MEITTWGIAMAYLLAVAAGFTEALLVLVWLFGVGPGEGTRTGHKGVEGSPSAYRFGTAIVPPASGGPESSDSEAA